MTHILRLIIFLFVRDIHVDSLSLCDDWKYLQVIEKSDENTYTCTGLREQQDVVWLLSGNRIATCPPPPSSCTIRDPSLNTYFRISRTSTTASNITVLATAAPTLDYFGTTSLTCEITSQENVMCPLDSVYPAEKITCKVQFNGDTWEVTSWCFVSKVRSTRNKYGCYLYQTQTQDSQGPIKVGSYNMITEASTPSGYFSGTCNMTSSLPSEGRYSYTVLIMPGQVNVSAAFHGSNEIRRPKSIPYHNCYQFVKEDEPVTCVCSVDDLGSPPGQLTWNNTNSEQLILPGVKMGQHGVNYVCSLTWNKTVVQFVTYTLLIAYPPGQLSFKLNNITSDVVTVSERSTVNMLCMSDGRPSPHMNITFVTNNNHLLESLPAGNVTLNDQGGELRHIVMAVTCEASGEYKCAADNGAGGKDHSVSLFVLCAPRLKEDASNSSEQGQIPSITFKSKPEQFHFRMVAFPAPVVLMKLFLGSSNCSNVKIRANDTVISADCVTQSLASVICTITVDNVLPAHVGLYEVVIGNNFGQLTLPLEIKLFQEDKETLYEEGYSRGLAAGLGIGIGVTLGVVLGVLVPAVVWIWRRNWILPYKRNKDGRPVESPSSREEVETFEQSCNPSGNTYDALHINDVCLTSHYSSLHSAKKCKRQSTENELPDESLQKITAAQIEVESAYSNSSL